MYQQRHRQKDLERNYHLPTPPPKKEEKNKLTTDHLATSVAPFQLTYKVPLTQAMLGPHGGCAL